MYAKIMHNYGVYYSPVFAVSMKENNCKAVVFDSSLSQLIVKTIFKGASYNVLFMDYNTDNFSINEKNLKSYWNDRNIFQKVKHKKYTPEMLEEAQRILATMKPQEYTAVTYESDLEALDFNTGSFHDGYILAMKEESDKLEILFDTSWGSLAVFKCKGIIENSFDVGCTFSHCEMDIDRDGVVTFSTSTICNDKGSILKIREMQFKPLFEKRIPLSEFDYKVDNHKVIINYDSQAIKIEKGKNDILDFSERNVLGYIQNDETVQLCYVFGEDVVYSFRQYATKKKRANSKIAEFKEECENKSFVFDKYPTDDFFEENESEYGEIIYSYKYKKLDLFSYVCKIAIPTLLLYNFLILSIQLFNPEMRWGFYLLFGLGISTLIALIISIATLSNNEQKYIEIYENVIKYQGYNTCFILSYENITEVQYNKKIIIHTSIGHFTLHKSKFDKTIFELINQKVSKKTSQ